MSTNSESLTDEDDQGCFAEDENLKRKKFVKQPRWICKREPAWRMYMKKCADDAKKRADAEREKYGDFSYMKQKEQDLSKIPKQQLSAMPHCQMLNLFNQRGRRCVDGKRPKTDIWDVIRFSPKMKDSPPPKTPFRWPKLAPCLKRDIVKERKVEARRLKMKRIGATPCQIEEIVSPESSEDEQLEELAAKKELVLARIPMTSIKENPPVMIDRACGERISLVDGDCIVYELNHDGQTRTYANLCLRGLDGMHLEELQRIREHTWKFCLFQSIVALLVKTQLRYKYAWSANIDYIYNHAWKIFVYTGYLNIKPNQKFDSILVYNYIYDVEIQLVHEIKDVPIIRDVTFEYFEDSLKRYIIERNKVTLPKCKFGSEKEKDNIKMAVHKRTRRLEKWFDKLEDQYTDCILRTTRFSLAFWQDGLFWFIYNPYRCDKYGFWDDDGYASITKFCSRDAMKRHIMILLLRAYVYKLDEVDMCLKEYNYFTIQIFQLVYHSCKIHNVKLYLRSPKEPKPQLVEKIKSDPCLFNPYDQLELKPCEISGKSDNEKKLEELNDKIEKPQWIHEKKISWSMASKMKPKQKREKWHDFEILESRRLFVLWCDMHITDPIFAEENRYNQARACYVVCAGMMNIHVPEYWTLDTLKAILVHGDAFYTKRLQRSLNYSKSKNRGSFCDNDEDWQEYPSDQFEISNIVFDVDVLSPIRGRLYIRGNQCLWRSFELFFQKHHFGIFTCESSLLGIFKHYGAYYILDAYSLGPPIFKSGDGKAYLLRAACFRDFIINLVLIIGSIECSAFSVRPVEIGNIVDTRDRSCEEPRVVDEEDCSYGAIRPNPKCSNKAKKKKAKKEASQMLAYNDTKKKKKTICVSKEKKD